MSLIDKFTPRVFVVQKQYKQDPATGELVPKHDLSSAYRYGNVEYLLSPTAGPFNPDSVIPELKAKLANYTSDDFLLLIGNPCLIGWAVAIAAGASGGRITLLQWSGKRKEYIPIESNVH